MGRLKLEKDWKITRESKNSEFVTKRKFNKLCKKGGSSIRRIKVKHQSLGPRSGEKIKQE